MIPSLVSFTVFVIMDIIYLSLLSTQYVTMVSKIQNGQKPFVKWHFAILSYGVLAIALLYVVFPYAKLLLQQGNSLWLSALKAGFLIGFVIYGVYNTTVLSVFKNYSVTLACIDTLWGSSGFFVAALVYLYFQRQVFFSS